MVNNNTNSNTQHISKVLKISTLNLGSFVSNINLQAIEGLSIFGHNEVNYWQRTAANYPKMHDNSACIFTELF